MCIREVIKPNVAETSDYCLVPDYQFYNDWEAQCAKYGHISQISEARFDDQGILISYHILIQINTT